MSYIERLHQAIKRTGTAALVGLDPRFERLPAEIVARAQSQHTDGYAMRAAAYEEFCQRLIDVVAPLVPAVKPQAAFFEELGPEGMLALSRVVRYARQQGLIVIMDAKRGDIGSTAEAYARGFLAGADPEAAPWAADALTVNPYLGDDTLEPFVKMVDERAAGLYVLVRTSNPGAKTFQDRKTNEQTVFEAVGQVVEQLCAARCESDGYGSIGAVVGATYPAELKMLRQQMPHVPFLVPGYGSQGGGAKDVAGAFDADGLGALVNNSRGINFAYEQPKYQERYAPDQWEAAVEAATRDMIADLAAV